MDLLWTCLVRVAERREFAMESNDIAMKVLCKCFILALSVIWERNAFK
uniref:Uncharacterized protein n=1 Tax=Pseudomonas aeruginosa TaxID=287 RepID=A0A5P9W9P2_PSEAI|nr:hypothetical protein PNK5461_c0023 [Pseudomonas aeruginosa]